MATVVVTDVPMINPESLDDKTKNELWVGLKQLDPELAKMLIHDPNISALKNSFSATVRFTRDKAREYVIVGRKVLEERNHDKQNHQLLQN